VTESNLEQIQECITCLKHHFSIRDLGDIHYFLGIEAQPNDNDLVLSQTKYLSDLLKRSNMQIANHASLQWPQGMFYLKKVVTRVKIHIYIELW
jgi:Reverse transcriptase (RNA-dependent DNA polymerase)